MVDYRGKRTLLLAASEATADAVVGFLAVELVQRRLGLSRAPRRSEILAGELPGDDDTLWPAEARLVTAIADPKPLGVALTWGWDYPGDPVREVDMVMTETAARPGLVTDAFISRVGTLVVCEGATKVRWRTPATRRLRRSFEHYGARLLSSAPQPAADLAGEATFLSWGMSAAQVRASLARMGRPLDPAGWTLTPPR